MFRRTDSEKGLAAVLALAQSIEPGEESQERKRVYLMEATDADLGRLQARSAPESVEEARFSYLRRESKIGPPSRRRLRIAQFGGTAAIVIVVILAIVVVVLGRNITYWLFP